MKVVDREQLMWFDSPWVDHEPQPFKCSYMPLLIMTETESPQTRSRNLLVSFDLFTRICITIYFFKKNMFLHFFCSYSVDGPFRPKTCWQLRLLGSTSFDVKQCLACFEAMSSALQFTHWTWPTFLHNLCVGLPSQSAGGAHSSFAEFRRALWLRLVHTP